MKLKKLSIYRFRNIEETIIHPEPGINVFFGNNGEGKTNFLESIYYLSILKSFRSSKTEDLVRWGDQSTILCTEVERNGVLNDIRIMLDREGRRLRVNGKPAASYAEYCGEINTVLFTPEEISMGRGAPEARRRYLNRAVLSGNVRYLSAYQTFAKTLKQRNALLKSGTDIELDIWTEKFSESAAQVVKERLTFLREIVPLLQEFYASISGGDQVDIQYIPSWSKGAEKPDSAEALHQALTARRREELSRGTTLAGPHRDEIVFFLNGKPVRQHASQGEQRSFIIALKMAEIAYLREKWGEPPVLLLDDLTSELDPERNHNLFEYLRMMNMQVFITTTTRETLGALKSSGSSFFKVIGGRIVNEVC
jgi:DNA replication and repair protein RecF